ncbi:hypothetical protein LOTGIDRAFT_176745, partial [Lottia gigantea]
FVNVEIGVTTVVDIIGVMSWKKRSVITGIMCLMMFLVSLIFTTEGGIYNRYTDVLFNCRVVYIMGIVMSYLMGGIYNGYSDVLFNCGVVYIMGIVMYYLM